MLSVRWRLTKREGTAGRRPVGDDRLPSGTSRASTRAQVVAPGARGAVCATSVDWLSRCTSAIASTRASSSSAAQSSSPSKPASTRSTPSSTERARLRRGSADLCLRRSLPAGSALLRNVRPPGRRGVGREPGRCRPPVNGCPRCGGPVVAGQEYCLECGVRLPGVGAVDAQRGMRSGWIIRALVAFAVALAGAALAVATTDGRSDGAALVTATGGFATAPCFRHAAASFRGWRGRHRGLAGRRGWLDDRARHASTDRRHGVSPSLERRRPAHAGSPRWGSSTPRSTPACIRATGWCSRASTDPKPRRRAICSVRADSPVPQRSAESFPETSRVVSIGDWRSRLCNRAEKSLHSPLRSFEAVDFPPTESDPSRSGAFIGRPHRAVTLLYVSILASDLPLDQVADRPVRRPRHAARISSGGALRVRADDGAARRGSALFRAARPRACSPTSGATSRSRHRRRSPGPFARASGRRRHSSSTRSRRACWTEECPAATRRRARARRASGRRFRGGTTAPRISISNSTPPRAA